MATKRTSPSRPSTKKTAEKKKTAVKKTAEKKKTAVKKTAVKNEKKTAARRSWTAFDRAAKRAVSSFRLGDREEGRAFLEESALSMPDDLLRLAVSIDDGARIDLARLGGAATQNLFDVAGLIDANHREEGGFGYRVAAGEIPEGLVMFGYGTHQLLYDTLGALGSAGAIWSCEDEDVTEAKKLADSLEALLAGATPLVVEEVEPPPPPKVKLMPTPPPFAAPREDSGLFSAISEAPVGWHLLQRGTELWFRGSAGELSAFDLVTEQWTTLRALPAGFEIPSALALRDGSVLLFPWHYASETHRCVRGDGRSEWVEVASLPAEAAVTYVGRGVLPDGRVLVAGGRAPGGSGDDTPFRARSRRRRGKHWRWRAEPSGHRPCEARVALHRMPATQRGSEPMKGVS